jgi:hypothetical protein
VTFTTAQLTKSQENLFLNPQTFLMRWNDGRYPLAVADQTRVVDFIVEKTK